MKVTDLRRKLMAALVAGGMMVPCTLHAADLATNLVVNGDFENVDLAIVSYYNAPLILNWSGMREGFAYSHDLSGESVPDFANGTLPSGGHWYFSPGNNFIHSFDDALTQDMDVSEGATASAIVAGTATFNLSAFFSTFDTQADRGFVKVDFLDTVGGNLGSAQINSPESPALPEWTQFTASGTIPAGTETVRIFSWGERFGTTGSADGYTDNIEFRVSIPIAGDYNNNGIVDAADYAAWRNAGATDVLPNDPTSGTVDGSDYVTWKANFGKPLGSGAGSSFSVTTVPEPSMMLLVGIGVSSLAAAGWRPHRDRTS